MEKLAPGYVPKPFDVICARGKDAYTHNKSFRGTLEHHLHSYASATSKQQKSEIVSMIFDSIKEATPEGGFIRKGENDEWYRVPVHVAREKIGQGFRDLLHARYRSSATSKVKRRRSQGDAPSVGSVGNDILPIAEDGWGNPVRPSTGDTNNSYGTEDPLPLDSSFGCGMDLFSMCSFSFFKDDEDEPPKICPPRSASPAPSPSIFDDTEQTGRRSSHEPSIPLLSDEPILSWTDAQPEPSRETHRPHPYYHHHHHHYYRYPQPFGRGWSYPGSFYAPGWLRQDHDDPYREGAHSTRAYHPPGFSYGQNHPNNG